MPRIHRSALDLPVPRTATSLMQHLQRLVGREQHRHWCGGIVSAAQLHGFVHKMEMRYPITRNARERSYDRLRKRAVVHMIVSPASTESSGPPAPATPVGVTRPPAESMVAWWLVSSTGIGGLADSTMPDAHVCKDAMAAGGHIVLGDYVLAYFTKKEPRLILDTDTGHYRSVFKDTSTWTWKLRADIVRQIQAGIDDCCARSEHGSEDTARGGTGRGLVGLLAAQRSRPLFAGVRSQVIDLHRYARDTWDARQAPRNGEDQKRSIFRSMARDMHLFPKMVRVRVYDEPPCRVRELTKGTP